MRKQPAGWEEFPHGISANRSIMQKNGVFSQGKNYTLFIFWGKLRLKYKWKSLQGARQYKIAGY